MSQSPASPLALDPQDALLPAETPLPPLPQVLAAMQQLTTYGARAAEAQMDSVRVPTNALAVVCESLYLLMRRMGVGPAT